MSNKVDLTIYVEGHDPITATVGTTDDRPMDDMMVRNAIAEFWRLGCNHSDHKTGVVTCYPPGRIEKIEYVSPNVSVGPVSGIQYIIKN